MVIKGTLNYGKAIILTEQRLREMISMLNGYGDRIELEAVTKNNTRIQFESIEELLKHDNFKENVIHELEVSVYNNFSRVIFIDFALQTAPISITSFSKIVNCIYSFETEQERQIFVSDFNNLLKKSTASYWIVSKFSLSSFVFGLSWLIFPFELLYGAQHQPITVKEFITSAFFALAIICATVFLDRKVLRNLFPPIVFAIGEEVARNEKNGERRKNVFWGVIVALILAVVAPKISSFLHMVFRIFASWLR
ncbi:MAG: hypothetical protein IJT07_01025 [Oscillospiraceae bacterium]|nr:hypothetical protein [Oscillospiraceae bacterium]